MEQVSDLNPRLLLQASCVLCPSLRAYCKTDWPSDGAVPVPPICARATYIAGRGLTLYPHFVDSSAGLHPHYEHLYHPLYRPSRPIGVQFRSHISPFPFPRCVRLRCSDRLARRQQHRRSTPSTTLAGYSCLSTVTRPRRQQRRHLASAPTVHHLRRTLVAAERPVTHQPCPASVPCTTVPSKRSVQWTCAAARGPLSGISVPPSALRPAPRANPASDVSLC